MATVFLLFTLSGPVKASTYLVRNILPYELVIAMVTVWLTHLKLTTDIFSSKLTLFVMLLTWVLYWRNQH